MHNHWKARTALALSVGLILSGAAYAEEAAPAAATDTPAPATEAAAPASAEAAAPAKLDPAASLASVPAPVAKPDPTKEATPSMNAPSAEGALKQKKGDATSEKNLEQVFKASEKVYSLSKKGSVSSSYDLDYTFFRDTRLDLALDDSSSVITRLRIGDEAQHTITNTFDVQYGLLDNLTLTAALPIVARSDLSNGRKAVGLGDIGFGARWEPFPIERGKMPLILFGSLSTRTGDSPYEINPNFDLSTGKGYYSIGGGASTRKFIDPIVLFASGSLSYGIKESDINQNRGGRQLVSFSPGINGGASIGFAYSLNYDVSLTMSFQQSFATGSEFVFLNGEKSTPADQTSASMSMALGVRVSPKTIVNGSVGFGLTEDAADVSLGLSFPLDFESFTLPDKLSKLMK